MNAIEFKGVTVEHPAVFRRTRSFKEWLVRRVREPRIDLPPFAALSEVTFDIPSGQAVGIVGPNGAGKSTLLRVATGIIQPTRGMSITRGKLAPIIELGTGFDTELTGRENIFFNGALLGRSRAEMRQRLEEIIDFAELHEFIDAPLRTYSSGMVARLAFAIATSIDAEIILLDEILSVGDAKFREKCGARVQEFLRCGATIVIVSHDLGSINSICPRSVWIEGGRVRLDGPSPEVIFKYQMALGLAHIHVPKGDRDSSERSGFVQHAESQSRGE